MGSTGRSVALEVRRYLAIPVTALRELDDILAAKPSPKTLQAYLDAKTGNQPELASILVLSGEGRVLAMSPVDKAIIGTDYSGQPSFSRVRAGASIVLSSPYVSPADGSVTVTAYRRAGQGYGAVSLRLEELSAFISSIRISAEDRIAITDASGHCAADTDFAFVREQRSIPVTWIAEAQRVREGGKDWIVSTTHIPGPDWHVNYYRDPREANEILKGLSLRLGLLGLLTTLAAAWAAWRLERSFSKPLGEVLSLITDLSSGNYARRAPLGRVEEFNIIADSFNAMAGNIEGRDEKIRSDLAEKVILLKEIHHRVKNNLQIMASLLNLGGGRINDAANRAIFKDSQDRIHSMALVHEILYESEDFSSIDLGLYASCLLAYLHDAWPLPGLRMESQLDPVRLTLDKALPCGLILNELITNAFKYALSGSAEPYLRVGVSGREGGRTVVLEVEDHGPGMPRGEGGPKATSLGFSLVTGLAKQLGAELQWLEARPGQEGPGLLVRLTFQAQDGAPAKA